MKRQLFIVLIGLLVVVAMVQPVYAATTSGGTLTYTPANVEISDNVTDIDFGDWSGNGYGVVYLGSTVNTSTALVGITNSSNIQTDITVAVTGNEWTGTGTNHTHNDSATAGADQTGLKSNRGGSWGTGDVIVKYSSPNYIYENCPASTNFTLGFGLQVPTAVSDYNEKSNGYLISAEAG